MKINRLSDSLFAVSVLILTLILWRIGLDFLYLYCKEWPTLIKVLITFFSPFLILAGIWNLAEIIENLIHVRNKTEDDI
jgi:hypothetical protein